MKSAVGFSPLVIAFLLGLLASAPVPASAGPLGLVLPTENDAIFSDDPSKFYMYTYRNFEGVSSAPWSGGRYGLTRDQKRTDQGILFTKFHEGIDIRPVKRDSANEPLDDVFAIADGKVVYVNASPSKSSYGNYVVIEHNWGEGPFYSLYAHLKATLVQAGQPIKARQRLGRLGYTGAGINRERAHVHVELAMMLSTEFQTWYNLHFTSKNEHGNFNGYNLAGLDIASLFHSHRDNPQISIAQFVAADTPYYKVVVPNRGTPEMLKRYSWLGKDMDQASANPSWEFTFNHVGVPLAIAPSKQSVTNPAVSWVHDSKVNHAYNTIARLSGTGSKATLSGSGSRYIQLVTGGF
ncbi:MAG: M23 family metallopeptidase [Verrucomicrobiae bacterium]|nr:M23 family metallopeptidase [Verrucomicrobiae bacterium]